MFYHGIERLQARLQVGKVDQHTQNHTLHFDACVEHVLHFFQIGHMHECAAVGLQIDDFIVRQQRKRTAHGIARAGHLAAEFRFGELFARQQHMVGNAV